MSTPPTLPPDADCAIVTPRLEQIPMQEAHAPEMYPILADAALYTFTGGEAPASVEALATRYAFLSSRRSPEGDELWLNWMIRCREDERAVGFTQATVHATHAYVAWVVGTEWQGRGYASEAAAALVAWIVELGVPDVRACVNPAHVASRRVAHNAGLTRTDEMIDGENVWVRGRP